MRTDTANGSFGAILGIAAGAFGVFAVVCCCLFGVLVAEAASGGVGQLAQLRIVPVLVLLALLTIANVACARSLWAQLHHTRELTAEVARAQLPTPSTLTDAAARAGMAGRVVLVDADGSGAFTYGFATPTIVVSRGLVERASPDELTAVLTHERYHALNHDPLKVLVARALRRGLCFLPVLGEFEDRYLTRRELAADRRAISAHGSSALAGALYHALEHPAWGHTQLGTAAAIGGDEALEARLTQLESGAQPRPRRLSTARLGATVAGGGVLLGSAVASLVAYGPDIARACRG